MKKRRKGSKRGVGFNLLFATKFMTQALISFVSCVPYKIVSLNISAFRKYQAFYRTLYDMAL